MAQKSGRCGLRANVTNGVKLRASPAAWRCSPRSPRLVAGEAFHLATAAGLILEVDVGKRLIVGVDDLKTPSV